MQNCKNILLKISVMNVLCCLSLGVIKPCQVNAEGSFTETYWIPKEAYSAYELLNAIGLTEGAEGDTFDIISDFSGTIESFSYTSGNGTTYSSSNGTYTISDIVMNIVNDLPTISQNTGNLLDIKFETGSELPAVNEIGCTFDGYIDYGEQTDNYNFDTLSADCNIQGLSGEVSIYDAAAWNEALSWHVDLYTAGTDPITGEETQDAITITAVNTETGSEVLNLTTQDQGTIEGSLTTSANGSWNYQLPWLKFTDATLSSKYVTTTNYPKIWGTAGVTSYFAFIMPSHISTNSTENANWATWFYNNLKFIMPNGSNISYRILDMSNGATFTNVRSVSSSFGLGYKKYLIKLEPTTTAFEMVFSSNFLNLAIVPLYYGYGDDISDDYRRFIGLSDRLYDLIANGNQNSYEAGNNLDDAAGDFGGAANDLIGAEDSALNDMGSSLSAIDTSNIIGQLGSFNSANRWVVQQFETLTTNNPVGIFISVSLVLALAAVLVGRL